MPTPKTNDAALLALLQSDPQAGLARLLDAYGGLIHGVVRRILPRNPEDAEECVADVLVAAWQSAGRLAGEPDRPLQGWLTLTARHIAIDRYRRLRRRPGTDPLDETWPQTGCWSPAPAKGRTVSPSWWPPCRPRTMRSFCAGITCWNPAAPLRPAWA